MARSLPVEGGNVIIQLYDETEVLVLLDSVLKDAFTFFKSALSGRWNTGVFAVDGSTQIWTFQYDFDHDQRFWSLALRMSYIHLPDSFPLLIQKGACRSNLSCRCYQGIESNRGGLPQLYTKIIPSREDNINEDGCSSLFWPRYLHRKPSTSYMGSKLAQSVRTMPR